MGTERVNRFLKKLPDDLCSSITKGSIYHTKHIMSIQHFTMKVYWPKIGHLHVMEVSVMLNICTYWVFTLYSRDYNKYTSRPWTILLFCYKFPFTCFLIIMNFTLRKVFKSNISITIHIHVSITVWAPTYIQERWYCTVKIRLGIIWFSWNAFNEETDWMVGLSFEYPTTSV